MWFIYYLNAFSVDCNFATFTSGVKRSWKLIERQFTSRKELSRFRSGRGSLACQSATHILLLWYLSHTKLTRRRFAFASCPDSWPFFSSFNDIFSPSKTKGKFFPVLRNFELTFCQGKLDFLYYLIQSIKAFQIDIYRREPLGANIFSESPQALNTKTCQS